MQSVSSVSSVQSVEPRLERKNIRHLYLDLFWMCVPFALEWYFLQVYAIRMGATAVHLGLLTSFRALMMVVGSILANRWRHRYANSVKALTPPILSYRTILYL